MKLSNKKVFQKVVNQLTEIKIKRAINNNIAVGKKLKSQKGNILNFQVQIKVKEKIFPKIIKLIKKVLSKPKKTKAILL